MINKVSSIQIGILGGTSSGKTLYLACLQRFFDNFGGGYRVVGADNQSRDWLEQKKKELQGPLPAGTSVEQNLNFVLGNNLKRIEISVIDKSGKDFHNHHDEELINYLADCAGFVILVDPFTSLANQSAFYRPLFESLYMTLFNNEKTMDKRFSICLTKIDDSKFWAWLNENENNFPKGAGKSNAIFRQWFSEENPADNFAGVLENLFGAAHFRYHLISSIGFFQRDDGSVSSNLIILDDGSKRLRNGTHYSPVNLSDPIFWAAGSK